MQKEIIILPENKLYLKLAGVIKKISEDSISQNNVFTLALSGGRSPAPLFDLLTTDFKDKINWDKTHIFLVDERAVDIKSNNRNYKFIFERLLKPLNINKKNIHAPEDDLSKPEIAAIIYENTIKNFFGNDSPSFDLMILGIGLDGHTASIFPDDKNALFIKDRLVINTFSNVTKPTVARISISLNLINNSKNAAFLALGENKKVIVNEILKNNPLYPASYILPKEKIYFFYDSELV
jgi:6-phosphogluconolactonase